MTTAVTVLALAAVTLPASAIYVRIEARRVPVERLVANLERDLQSEPENVQKLINLGRLHAMAFALKADELPSVTLKPGGPDVPWYGNEPGLVPPRNDPAKTTEQGAAARDHLAKALQYYGGALKLNPENLTAALGHAWLLHQSGDKARAIDEYRQLIARAWTNEQKAKRAMLGQRFFTEEAAGYLIPLLDPGKDAAEISELQARRERLRAMPRPITPIAIPLAADVTAKTILDPLARVRFDADGSGLRREWTWITADAGWLVYDANGSGSTGSALQWFGNVTFWLFWSNGYEAMNALDDDGDGELAGAELRHLAVWHDRNRNGLSEAGEVQPLAAHHITALSCRYITGDGAWLAAFSPRGVRLVNGTTRPTYDVILHPSSSVLTRR